MGTTSKVCKRLLSVAAVIAPMIGGMAYADQEETQKHLGSGAINTNDPDQNKANYFIVPYLMSFRYDQCGDSDLGASYRKAIKDKVVECHLSDKAQKLFNQQSVQNEKEILPQLDSYHHIYGNYPDVIDGGKTKCAAIISSPVSNNLKTNLENYQLNKIPLSSVISNACPTGQPVTIP